MIRPYLLLFHPDQFRGVVAATLGLGEDGVEGLLRQFGRARENPEVLGALAADECPAVVGIEQHHAVVGVERSEERHAQQGGGVSGLGLAVGGFLLAVLDAGVGDGDLAVLAQGVVGLAEVESALEAVVVAGQLVPVAEIALQVKLSYSAVVNFVAGAACGEQQGKQGCEKGFLHNG